MTITLGFYNPQSIKDIFSLPGISQYHSTDFTSGKNNILYFDTINYDLHKAGIRFYAVNKTKNWVATIVGEDTSTIHGIWEVDILKLPFTPTLAIFTDEKMKDTIKKIIGDKALVYLMGIEYSQQSGILEIGKNKRIRITYDEGKIVGGEKVELISEFHLIPLDVTGSGVMQIAVEIASVVPVYVETESQYLRGLYLTGLMEGELETAVDCYESAQNGLNALLTKQIERIFAAKKKFIRESFDSETLHQLRVQIRRLRVYLQLAGTVLHNEEYLQWKDYFRTWGHSMNTLRDTDVLIGLYREASSFVNLDGENSDPLKIVLQTKRREETEKVKAELLSGKSAIMLLRFTLWLNENAFVPKAKGLEFKKITIKRLQKWIRWMQEMGRELDTKTMPGLHQLRITGKKVRYVIEELKLDSNDRVSKNLKMLQDDLGNIHDAAIQAETLEKLISNHTSKIMHRNVGILIGWTARIKYESQQKLNKDWGVFCCDIKLWQKHVKK